LSQTDRYLDLPQLVESDLPQLVESDHDDEGNSDSEVEPDPKTTSKPTSFASPVTFVFSLVSA
jgi:hypothetical protein